MKPHLLKIHLQPDQSFSVLHVVVAHFYNKWHHHPELELVHIIKGSGRQFIGDHVHHFKSGDMILLGADLPHYWRSEDSYFAPDSQQKCEAIVVHFMPNFLGETFFNLPENKAIVRLLQKAQQAVRIKNNTQKHISQLLEKLVVAKNSERIILLLQILEAIANSKDTKTICSKGLEFHYNPREADRLNAIYQFVLQNFSSEITLKQVAKVAHISPQSFCRYFKSRIKKTFSKFLIEVRIGHACKLLAETNKSIADICYECGYNNFSNFNRHFKNITQKTPLEHRHHYTMIGK
ncbi:MAG: AraC family transcriptional regulator [Flavobacterium sp.]|nr:AraC family transcriptional regulator [Flavobacterium sp.]